jgi:GWxTD domain-containing protein
VQFYVEAYGVAAAESVPRLQARVAGEDDQPLHVDTVLMRDGEFALRSALIRIPVARVGFGALALDVMALDSGGRRSVAAMSRAPLVVSFGDGLTAMSYEEMLSYLRFFATPERLLALQTAPVTERAKAWAAFVAGTDPMTSKSVREALREYFGRLGQANSRFREEGISGWQTDRGMILSAFGEPDNILEPSAGDPIERARVQIWEYHRYRTRFIFVQQGAFGRWNLTPESEAQYHPLMRRLGR